MVSSLGMLNAVPWTLEEPPYDLTNCRGDEGSSIEGTSEKARPSFECGDSRADYLLTDLMFR